MSMNKLWFKGGILRELRNIYIEPLVTVNLEKNQKDFTIQLDFICLHKPFSGNQEREGETLKPNLFFISNRSPDVL